MEEAWPSHHRVPPSFPIHSQFIPILHTQGLLHLPATSNWLLLPLYCSAEQLAGGHAEMERAPSISYCTILLYRYQSLKVVGIPVSTAWNVTTL